MSPWAGRVRDGIFVHDSASFQLPLNSLQHALHGTVFDREWQVVLHDNTHVLMRTDFGDGWPLGGHVEQRVEISDNTVALSLTAFADGTSMPVQVGWHPWFVRPQRIDASFTQMLLCDEHGVATDQLVETTFAPTTIGTYDDCFVANAPSPLLTFAHGVQLQLASDCHYWVVYDKPTHAVCVEPQSGPPNGFTLRPDVIGAGQSFTRNFHMTLAGYLQVE